MLWYDFIRLIKTQQRYFSETGIEQSGQRKGAFRCRAHKFRNCQECWERVSDQLGFPESQTGYIFDCFSELAAEFNGKSRMVLSQGSFFLFPDDLKILNDGDYHYDNLKGNRELQAFSGTLS